MELEVCGLCALRIRTLKNCPRDNPLPAPVVSRGKGSWSQSVGARNREIAKAEAIKAARDAPVERETYQQKITRLSGAYGKKKRKR